MLTGNDQYFLTGSIKEREVFNSKKAEKMFLQCDIPIIAVMKGDCRGTGWLVGELCDFIICSEESNYQYIHADPDWLPESIDWQLAYKYFGKNFGTELLTLMKCYKGKDLKPKGLGITILPKSKVDSYAVNLAINFAEMQRGAILLLKRHLSELGEEGCSTSMEMTSM